ncbi:Protoheme IX farnesyltransferase [Pestalotiopsis fici W106-1]|uniref:Protoheme IX farnesyltransferase, mitochondrial n=1 Tax=Pestalotiopsis fici (strain W106-1 / CGMCC3.15140) TaxID=1229662 RepID=W3WJY7_PESFW|nr:Protoheme IX farnesyltransferase [Pestalotiopsis fici W106-1]ETS73121.1 Protoheme IX farnesyltransferase [Pestalotiopsis fici W106-1]
MNIRPPRTLLRPGAADSVCWQCSLQLSRSRVPTAASSRTFAQSFAPQNAIAPRPRRLRLGYFFANSALPLAKNIRSGRYAASTAAPRSHDEAPTSSPTTPHPNQDLPHRRRQAAKRKAALAAAEAAGNTPGNSLPAEDASSALTTSAANHSAKSFRRQFALYLSLSKPRLSMLVVLTSMSSYALYPVPDFLSPTIGVDAPSLSPLTLAFLTTGTALCSASANALNMLYEPDTDAKMSRTRNRPLVRGLLTQRKAVVFAILAAATGVGALYFGVNPTVAALGATNVVLYAGVYTPMKRLHWLNTWVGAIVGGIPPLMGWAAAAGEAATDTGGFEELLLTRDAIGGWLLAGLLFAWQFPHFMALSWSIREEYKIAGHKMLAWINPARNGRVALRYSLAFFPICFGLCAVGVTEWSFAVTSLPINVWLTREAVRFWKHEGYQGSARGLFWASVWHLPVVMVFALVQKKGMWSRVWRAVFGEPLVEDDEDEDEWEDEEITETIPKPKELRIGS